MMDGRLDWGVRRVIVFVAKLRKREKERERVSAGGVDVRLGTYMMRVGSWRPLTLLHYRVFNMSQYV